ncbi:glycoside hydrolase family 125 protein [Thermoanaerobacter uzonensis]|uniref:glycoside hydrolase family 125 protein n=1 Tax=Thermoanaerobacter uzonensis TaxID=447593 RepID=UPI003D769D13
MITVLKNKVEEISNFLNNEKLKKMFVKSFLNTLETTIEKLNDGSVYVITGDIPAMWLRDSTGQIKSYLKFANEIHEIKEIIMGVIKRQIMYIKIDPYANAFNKEPNNNGHIHDIPKKNPWVWERKYEIDSLCYPIQLAYLLWKETGFTEQFSKDFRDAIKIILKVWKTEQHHEGSNYTFKRIFGSATDTLINNGKGTPVNYTGMTWSGFRPSDDRCIYGYLIPSNMFAVVVLGYIEEIAHEIYKDIDLENESQSLKNTIENGIKTYGIINHPKYGLIYAYEVDGFGNYILMDDANIPSLLSIPYIGYRTNKDPIYVNTRKFILSKDNPYYYEGQYAKGVGSPHTPERFVWPMSLIIQALTSDNNDEISEILQVLLNTDADTNYIHESFNVDNPKEYTRDWFAWANSLFAELILKIVGV